MARTPEEKLEALKKGMDLTTPGTVATNRGRSSGRRPRMPGNGMHPNSLAALALNRTRTQLDAENGVSRQRCKRCKRVVVKGLDVCYFHGGGAVTKQRRRANGQPVSKTSAAAIRNVRKLFEAGDVPVELLRDPLYQAVGKFVMPKTFGLDYDRSGEVRPKVAARLLMHEMTLGWIEMDRPGGDPGPWTRAVGKAFKMGFRSG